MIRYDDAMRKAARRGKSRMAEQLPESESGMRNAKTQREYHLRT